MPKVLFLSPPRRHDGSMYLFNNASLSLASYLQRRGLDSWVHPLAGADWRGELARALSDHRPDLVAVSCKWWDTLYGAVEVARLVKAAEPGVKVVAGGQTASSFHRELVERGGFDAVIRGDGELPLWELAQGHPSCNLTYRTPQGVEELPLHYVQSRQGDEDLTLVEDLSQIADRRLLLQAGFTAPYVWTGKGCQSACVYCAGSAWGHKHLFGRTGYLYRPLEQTLSDMQALAPWTRNTFMFDFDPVTDPGRLDYYRELCDRLEPKRYHAAFYCWSLPDRDFLERVSATFRSALVSIDAQTYSEPLRQRLAERNQLKPFASDRQILDLLDIYRTLPNLHADVYGIVGLPGETGADVRRAEEFMHYLHDRYLDVLQTNGVNLTPMTVEPMSLMDRNPDKFGLVRLRHSFEEYLEFTGSCFARSGGGVFSAPYAPDLPHPYGIHMVGEDPGRVHADYRRMEDLITERSDEFAQRKAYAALRCEPTHLELRLGTRTIFQDDWRLVVWAAEETLRRELPVLLVDARQAHLRVPPLEMLEFDERFDYLSPRLGPLREALAQGRLSLRIAGTDAQHWGFLAELGARLGGL